MREARSPALSLCRAYSIVIGSTRLQFKQGRIPAIIRTNRSSQKDSRSSLSRKRIVSSRSRISRNPYGLPVTEQYCSQGFTPKCSSMRSEERRVGKRVSVRVDLGGRRIIKKKKVDIKGYAIQNIRRYNR